MEPWIVEVGVLALGPEKILFGSDAAEGFEVGRTPGRARPPRSYAGLIAGLRERDIPEAALEKILYENARKIFNIKIESTN
jgi:predicted TIM-barrel fold metal-dependent hydrolase